jgi:spore germination protein KA
LKLGIFKKAKKDSLEKEEYMNEKSLEKSLEKRHGMEGAKIVEPLIENIDFFEQLVGNNHGVHRRNLKLNGTAGVDAVLLFVDGLVNAQMINDSVMQPLLKHSLQKKDALLLEEISERVIPNLKVEFQEIWSEIIDKMFTGHTILLVDGVKKGLVLGTQKWQDRGVEDATSEQIIGGPRESFSETLETNTMLLRRRIKSYSLQMDHLQLGDLTKTDIVVTYVKGVVNPKLVKEVKERIGRIQTDSIQSVMALEEFIEDNTFSVMPQMMKTERPDKSVGHLLDGGIVVLVDGSPNSLLLPVVFWNFLYSPEDYNERLYTTIILRTLRFGALGFALALPSLYIAISSFHHEMIPIGLLQIVVSGKRDVPFPILVEVFIMEIILEMIREAGVRLPNKVGPAISIVGALVLGDAAIQAKLASPATVTVVALTAIANFSIPSFSVALSIRVLRFGFMIASGVLGIFGFMAISFVLLIHLCSLRSFGVPFLAPVSPLIPSDLKDTQVRMPIWMMQKRPKFLGSMDGIRQAPNQKPGVEQNQRK